MATSDSNERTQSGEAIGQPQQKEPDLATISGLVPLFHQEAKDEEIKGDIAKHVALLAEKHDVSGYKILLLYGDGADISDRHSNLVYQGATADPQGLDILLILYSGGGRIEPAYLISKTCKRMAKSKFVVAVPRKAKSAATLIALGADEIHMGLMSELGPIDPQIGGFPTLGIRNALNVLADLSCKYPGCSEMIRKYLAEKLDLSVLGYLERVSESAVQYAERLLSGKTLPEGSSPYSLADHFVNYYKDHGFVIDVDEATGLLGSGIVRQKTKEYAFANAVHSSLLVFSVLFNFFRKQEFDYVGSVQDGLTITKKEEE